MRWDKQYRRNRARILSCSLHSFDCLGAVKREEEKLKKWGVYLLIPPEAINCRCKNCGGTMSLLYAAAYMDAVKHMGKQEEQL